MSTAPHWNGQDLSEIIEIIQGSSIRNLELLNCVREDADVALFLISALSSHSEQIVRVRFNECELPRMDLSTLTYREFECIQSDLTANDATLLCRTIPLHLKKLVLSYNPIGDVPVGVIADMIQREGSLLDDLQLIACEISDIGAIALAKALATNTLMTKLALSANHITNKGVSALCSALKATSSLNELQIGYNPLGDLGFQSLANALDRDVPLDTLYLHGVIQGRSCSIPETHSILVQSLGHSKSLRELNLSFNHLGDPGATLIAEVLKISKTVEILFLTNCYIGDKGTNEIAANLGKNQSLQELYLTHNNFHDDGILSLARAIKVNTVLKRLDLGAVSCGPDAAQAMVAVFQECYRDTKDGSQDIFSYDGEPSKFNMTLREFHFMPSCWYGQMERKNSISRFFDLEFDYIRSCSMRKIFQDEHVARLSLILHQLSMIEEFGSDLLYHCLRSMPDKVFVVTR